MISIDRRTTSAFEWYATGLEGLLELESEHRRLLPTMSGLASYDSLRRFLDSRHATIQRQLRRLELLLRAMPGGWRREPADGMESLSDDVDDLRRVRDPDERDAELVNASAWISNLKIEQYAATRRSAEWMGRMEAANHLQRSLDAEGAAGLRLMRISERMACCQNVELVAS